MLRSFTSILLMAIFLLPIQSFAEEEYWEYIFKQDDSIWRIADRYTTSANNWYEITKINRIRLGPDRKIKPGTRIVIPVSMLKDQPVPATVLVVNGGAKVIHSDGSMTTLSIGDKVYATDTVITEEGQRAVIQFSDTSVLQILPNSEAVLDQISYSRATKVAAIRVRLNAGSVYAIVIEQISKSRYVIQTPASGTAVKTSAGVLRVSSGIDRKNRTEVTDGSAYVSLGDENVNVEKEQGLISERGRPLPLPIKLLPAPELKLKVGENVGEVHASWKRLDSTARYRYELSTDKDFNDIVVDKTTIHNDAFIGFLETGEYFLRVRAIHYNGLEGIDAVSSFEIKEIISGERVEDDSEDPLLYNETFYAAIVWVVALLVFGL